MIRFSRTLRLISFSTTLLSGGAMALAQEVAATPQQQPFWMSLVPFIFLFVVMYFLMIRPQAKKLKEQQSFHASLKRGDEVITKAGILGRIEGLTDQFVTLEIAAGVRVKVLRNFVASYANSAEAKS